MEVFWVQYLHPFSRYASVPASSTRLLYRAFAQHKVERMVIDGVLDAENYFKGKNQRESSCRELTHRAVAMWSDNLLDADKALQSFFDGCAAAGPEGCAFCAPTPDEIAQNLAALYESVRARPLPVRTESRYGLVDFDLLRRVLFDTLHFPWTRLAPAAEMLAALSRGDGSPLLDLVDTQFECSCDPTDHQFDAVVDSELAIHCNDGGAVPSGFDNAQQHYDDMVQISSWGSLGASIRISCSYVPITQVAFAETEGKRRGWPDLPKKHFQGTCRCTPFHGVVA